MNNILYVKAYFPSLELQMQFAQHLRDFDTAHPECHFITVLDAPNATTQEIEEKLKAITPYFPHFAKVPRDKG